MQSLARKSLAYGLTAAAVALAFPLLASPGYGQSGPFAHLAGTWSGAGTITTSSGGSERIRCRARYVVSEGGRAFQQALVCASDSYKFDVSSSVESQGGTLTGTWQESTRGVSGNLSGRIVGQHIQARVDAVGFTAGLSVTTSGRSQAVSIRPQNAEIADVSVSLHK